MTANIRYDGNADGFDALETPDLIAAEGLYRLRDRMVLTWMALDNPYDEYWGIGSPKHGNTITIERPYYASAMFSEDGIIDSSTAGFYNAKIDRSLTVNIKSTIGAGLRNAPSDVQFSLTDYSRKYVKPVVEKMGDTFESRIGLLCNDFYLYAGTPGQAMNFMTCHDVNEVASENSIQIGTMNNFAIMGFADRKGVQKEILRPTAGESEALAINLPEMMVGTAIQRSYKGDLADWNTVVSAFLPKYEVQGMTSVAGAEPTPMVNSATAVRGNSVATDGWPANEKVLREGQMIEFAGIYQAKKTGDKDGNVGLTSKLASFRVMEDVTADAAGRATIKVYPEIIAGDGLDTMVHLLGDDATYKLRDLAAQLQTDLQSAIKPFRTVSKAIPDNTAIGIVGMMKPGDDVPAHSASNETAVNPGPGQYARYNQVIFLHTDAWAAVPLTIPGPDAAVNAGNYGSFMDDESGLAISYLEDYDDYVNQERLDAMFGAWTIYREIGLRVITERVPGNLAG